MSEQKEYYTSGTLAKLSGVSYKTIRHYVEKGLLWPEQVTESGYKLFGKKSVQDLQKILLLKYLDFDLFEIKKMMYDGGERISFEKQEQLVREKIVHLNEVLHAITEINQLSEADQWDQILAIMQITSQKEEIQRQYLKSDNLESRIKIHAYSTAKESWYEWLFQKIQLSEGMQVLDVGCGNGALWAAMQEQIPEGVTIVLLDKSAGMLEAARANLAPFEESFARRKIQFTYQEMNANALSLEGNYDRVMANHMLYHISDSERPVLLERMGNMLAEDGRFLASTVGEGHMREIFDLIGAFDSQASAPVWMSSGFSLENGREQLLPFFANVHVYQQENNLLVPDPMAVYDYLYSLPGNIHQLTVKHGRKLKNYLRNVISEEKPFFIRKSTGVLVGSKKGKQI